MLSQHFTSLYRYTMTRAYNAAYAHIASSVGPDSDVLDCGASNGWTFDLLLKRCELTPGQYRGIEWDARYVEEGRNRGLNIMQGDLTMGIPVETGCIPVSTHCLFWNIC